jgi:hypothetical protein
MSYSNKYTLSYLYIRLICYKVTRGLCELSADGDEYSGLYSAWCFLIACISTDNLIEYEKICEILKYVSRVNKSVRFL